MKLKKPNRSREKAIGTETQTKGEVTRNHAEPEKGCYPSNGTGNLDGNNERKIQFRKSTPSERKVEESLIID